MMEFPTWLKLAAHCAATAAVAAAPAKAFEASPAQLFPICAYGRILYAPFPGDGNENRPGHGGLCHAARLDDRAWLNAIKPKSD